jgi:hypothetical protein
MNFSFSRFYEECLKIHAICDDLDYSKDDARLFTNIHVLMNTKGKDFFDKESFEHELLAVDILLSPYKPNITSPESELVSKLCVGAELKKLDSSAETHGHETFFTTQLRIMKQLYSNSAFRRKKIKIYEEKIKPRITEYDTNKVKKTFKHAREREAREQRELNRLINLK